MSYGFATHLWVLGVPAPAEIKAWVVAAAPNAHQGDVEVWRLGDRVLVGAVNTSDREMRWRSIGIVNSLSSAIEGFDWVCIDMQPDLVSWRIENSDEVVEWDSEKAEGEHPEAPTALVGKAKTLVRSLVPLKLDELHHYVDWAHELEETQEGAMAPGLGVPVHRLSLGLPAAPPPGMAAEMTRGVTSGLFTWWLEVACIVSTAFTVSAVQGPGPGAFAARLNHFLIQAGALWLLAIVLMGVTSNGWPRFREFLVAAVAFAVSGLVWSALPV